MLRKDEFLFMLQELNSLRSPKRFFQRGLDVAQGGLLLYPVRIDLTTQSKTILRSLDGAQGSMFEHLIRIELTTTS